MQVWCCVMARSEQAPKIPGIRAMLPKDVKQACALLNTYLTKCAACCCMLRYYARMV